MSTVAVAGGPATRRRRVSSSPVAGAHLPGAGPHHGAGGLDPASACWPGPGRTGSWSVLWTPADPHRRRPARPDPRHPDPHGRASSSSPGPSACWPASTWPSWPGPTDAAASVQRPAAHRLGHPLGLPLHRARLRRLRGAGGRPALGLLAPAGAHHPLDHGHPLHRQDDRELAAPGARPATGRGPRPSGCRWATGCARWCSRARCPGIVTGLLLALAIACGETAPLIYTAGFANTLPHSLTHAQFPYLTYVVFTVLQRARDAVPLPVLRRRPDPGGDRAAPPGGEPHHRGPHPAPRRGRPRHPDRAAPQARAADRGDRAGHARGPDAAAIGGTRLAGPLWWPRSASGAGGTVSAGPEWGPLARLAGIWEGEQGEDVAYANEAGKIGLTPYREHVDFKPFGPVENGSQVLYGLDYRMAAWRGDEENPFHTEVGYWMWDARDSEVVRCFLIPRGSAIVAGATVGAGRHHLHPARQRRQPDLRHPLQQLAGQERPVHPVRGDHRHQRGGRVHLHRDDGDPARQDARAGRPHRPQHVAADRRRLSAAR